MHDPILSLVGVSAADQTTQTTDPGSPVVGRIGPASSEEGTAKPDDRRRCDRYAVQGSATATAETTEGESIMTGVVLADSSAVGFGIISLRKIPLGSTLGLHFDAEAIPTRRGTVARCEQIEINGGIAWRLGVDSVTCAPRGAA